MLDWFIFCGIVGLLAISSGVIMHNRNLQDITYIIGGIFLEIYSIHLGEWVFIVLQLVFIVSAAYDFIKRFAIEYKS
jgi:hypothetical protein